MIKNSYLFLILVLLTGCMGSSFEYDYLEDVIELRGEFKEEISVPPIQSTTDSPLSNNLLWNPDFLSYLDLQNQIRQQSANYENLIKSEIVLSADQKDDLDEMVFQYNEILEQHNQAEQLNVEDKILLLTEALKYLKRAIQLIESHKVDKSQEVVRKMRERDDDSLSHTKNSQNIPLSSSKDFSVDRGPGEASYKKPVVASLDNPLLSNYPHSEIVVPVSNVQISNLSSQISTLSSQLSILINESPSSPVTKEYNNESDTVPHQLSYTAPPPLATDVIPTITQENRPVAVLNNNKNDEVQPEEENVLSHHQVFSSNLLDESDSCDYNFDGDDFCDTTSDEVVDSQPVQTVSRNSDEESLDGNDLDGKASEGEQTAQDESDDEPHPRPLLLGHFTHGDVASLLLGIIAMFI